MIDNIDFADGEYPFFLGLAQINEIEAKCGNAGVVWARLQSGVIEAPEGLGIFPTGEMTSQAAKIAGIKIIDTMRLPASAQWRIADLIEPIRQGLIGAMSVGRKAIVDGVEVELTQKRINELIANYVLAPGKPYDAWRVALSVMEIAFVGYNPPKKAQPVKPAPRKRRKASSVKTDTQERSPTAA